MAGVCTNLQPNEDGDYEDPISYEVVPPGLLVHLPLGNATYCYDALVLLRYIDNEDQNGRPARLPDNYNLLTPLGVDEIRRTARAYFPQRYQVVSGRVNFPSFATEEQALEFTSKRPGRQFDIFQYASPDNPEDNDLLYPEGIEPTQFEPLQGQYFDVEAMERRASENRQADLNAANQRRLEEERAERAERAGREEQKEQKEQKEEPRPWIRMGEMEADLRRAQHLLVEDAVQRIHEESQRRIEERRLAQEEQRRQEEIGLRREGEIEVGDQITYEVRPGSWRCTDKESFYSSRGYRQRNPEGGQDVDRPANYCPIDVINQLRAEGHEVEDPRDFGIGETFDVDGERVSLFRETGHPGCSNDGRDDLGDMCRPDLITRLASRGPRRFIARTGDEIRYTYRPDEDKFYCTNLDQNGDEYECDDLIYDEMTWREEKPYIYRRRTQHSPIECISREERDQAVRDRTLFPWRECSEEQRVVLREEEFFRDLESGRIDEEVDELQ
jgi:hypothetical protein